jgi:hypothetical protein
VKLKRARTTREALLGAASLLLAALPAQALAQAAPAAPPSPMQSPAKVEVVVQPPAPGKAQVVVQSPGGAAPATKPVGLPTPQLLFVAPPPTKLGEVVTLRAKLADPDGKPISGAAIDFSSPERFLNTDGAVGLAQAVTDAQGTAAADWQARSDGSLTLTASFAGDKRFMGARATAAVEISGDGSLYEQQAGVRVPGLNGAPVAVMVDVSPSLSPWPRLSAWPLVVVLVIVWSLYARAVSLIFTIARGSRPTSSTKAIR